MLCWRLAISAYELRPYDTVSVSADELSDEQISSLLSAYEISLTDREYISRVEKSQFRHGNMGIEYAVVIRCENTDDLISANDTISTRFSLMRGRRLRDSNTSGDTGYYCVFNEIYLLVRKRDYRKLVRHDIENYKFGDDEYIVYCYNILQAAESVFASAE